VKGRGGCGACAVLKLCFNREEARERDWDEAWLPRH
jgi:hypothetical protein